MNLLRPDTQGTTNYYAYVLPEEKRRQRMANQYRGPAPTKSQETKRDISNYYKQWYGAY